MSEDEQVINFNREAFLQPLNLGFLFSGMLAAFLLSDMGVTASLILTLVFGIELIYLGVVPRLPRFQQITKSRKMRERGDAGGEIQLFKQLSPESKKRFLTLKHLAGLIHQNFEKLPSHSQGLLENIRNKIGELLSNYLTLLDLYNRYGVYMNRTAEEELKQEISLLEKRLEEASSERLRMIKERRHRILEKRLQKIGLAQEKFQICATHLETVEDAIRYIYEQSMTMSNAEEIGFQLDNLLVEVEETSHLIEELDQDMVAVYADSIGGFDPDESPEAGQESETGTGESEKKSDAGSQKKSGTFNQTDQSDG